VLFTLTTSITSTTSTTSAFYQPGFCVSVV
jgi:hypothetical protein